MSQLDYDSFQHHPVAEKIVQVMKDRIRSNSSTFFRLMVANYFSMAASTMRTSVQMPDGNPVPANMYSINLAPSNFGKTRAAKIMTKEVLNQFIDTFSNQTFLLLAERNLHKLAVNRSNKRGTDPDKEMEKLTTEFTRAGAMYFCYDGGSPSGVKQIRHKLLIARSGALNLVIDEIGLHIGKNGEMLDLFMELYDGETGSPAYKNTADNPRNSAIDGKTPSNMLLFGTHNRLLDGAQNEQNLIEMFNSGYGRRCFFSYVSRNDKQKIQDVDQAWDQAQKAATSKVLSDISDQMQALADQINNEQTILLPADTGRLLVKYQKDCEERAENLRAVEELRRTELESRFFKTIKLAGVYAFVDQSPEVRPEHLQAAIKLAEESGEAFTKMLNRDKPHVKLAKHIADLGEDVTHAELIEDLPFYPSAANKQKDMLTHAISWGYKNNILVKRSYVDGIEFLRGESLKETDLENLTVAVSDDIAHGYENHSAPWHKLHQMTQAPGLHWINHHLTNGHRQEDNAIAGFNLIVLDVEKSVPMPVAQQLLSKYKALFYTTKRHTPENHRYRIILPTNYELKLDGKDYKEFMNNLFEWLPFEVDEQTNQRAKKWLSHPGHYEYQEGELFDVLNFIPKTKKNAEHRETMQELRSLDNLERWFVNNTGDGNRNNNLMRYAMTLVDSGLGYDDVRLRVLELNDKLPDNLTENEIMGTIMVTVGREMAKRQAA